VQQEVVRRETEVARAVKESANARDALTHVQSVLAPFSANINASGADALGMMTQLFQADNALRHGSVADKAQVIANIIKSYGVDLVTLDSVLAGQAPTSDPTTMMADRLRREMQQQLQPVMQFVGQQQAQRQRAMAEINTNASTDVEAFAADEGHEFFDDVRDLMADIMDLHTARGATISLQDAYDRAIKIHPQVSEVFAKRAESERASAAAQAAQRARRTAVSLSSAPAPAGAVPGPAGDDRRAVIEAAWDQSSGG
jgi:3-keto-L-gulonate-6-phosphate decarboxylase